MKKIIGIGVFLFYLILVVYSQMARAEEPIQPIEQIRAHKLLVLLVDFSDTKIQHSEQEWYKRIFGDGKSVNSFSRENSQNKFEFMPIKENYGMQNDGIIRVSINMKNPYGDDVKEFLPSNEVAREAFYIAQNYIKEDIKELDTNGSKRIENDELHVCIIISNTLKSGESIYTETPHYTIRAAKEGLVINSIGVFDEISTNPQEMALYSINLGPERLFSFGFTFQPEIFEGNIIQIGILAHEIGHSLGVPDLYDTSCNGEGIGVLSLMACGSHAKVDISGDTPVHFDAYSKSLLGFGEVVNITSDGDYMVCSTQTGKYNMLWIPTGKSGSYILVENRQLSGYDVGMKSLVGKGARGGVVLYLLDKNWDDNSEKNKLLTVIEADEQIIGYSRHLTNTSLGRTEPFFPMGSVNEYFDDESGIKIKVNSPSSNYMTVNVSGITPEKVEMSAKNVVRFDGGIFAFGSDVYNENAYPIFYKGQFYKVGVRIRSSGSVIFKVAYCIQYLANDDSWRTILEGIKSSKTMTYQALMEDLNIPNDAKVGADNIRIKYKIIPNTDIVVTGKEELNFTLDVSELMPQEIQEEIIEE